MLYRRGMLSEAGYTHQSARWQGGKRQLDDDIPGGPPITVFSRSGRPGGLWCRQRTPITSLPAVPKSLST